MADRYWVGGAGTWNSTNTGSWSETSGGEGGASVPTSDDNVYFDGNSDVGDAFTVTVGEAVNCNSLTIDNANIELNLESNVNSVTFVSLINGYLNLNDNTIEAFNFTSSNSNVRKLNFASGTFILNGTGTVWDVGTPTNFTLDPGTESSKIELTSESAKTFSGGSLVYPALIQVGNGTLTILGNNAFYNIKNISYPTTILFGNGSSTTVKNLELNGIEDNLVTLGRQSSGIFTLLLSKVISLEYITISNATIDSQNALFLLNSVDGGGNTNCTFNETAPSARNLYWVGGTGTWDNTNTANWSETSGGESGSLPPTLQDNVFFDGSSDIGEAFTVTIGTGAVCKDIRIGDTDFSTVLSQTMTLGGTAAWNIYGNLFYQEASITMNYAGTVNFRSQFDCNISTNGRNISIIGSSNTVCNFLNPWGNWTLMSAMSVSGQDTFFRITQGTLNTNGFNLSVGRFVSDGNYLRSFNMGASTVTSFLNAAGGVSFTFSGTNITVDSGTSTLRGSNTGYRVISIPTLEFNDYIHVNTGPGTVGRQEITRGNFKGTVTLNAQQYILQNCIFTGDVNFNNTLLSVPQFIGNNIFNNLTFNSRSADGNGILTISDDQIISGKLTIQTNNTSPFRRFSIRSSVPGTTVTLTVNELEIGDSVDFSDIIVTGSSAPWDVSSKNAGDLGGNENILFPAPKTVYRIGTGNWSVNQWTTSSGGTPSESAFPLTQDTIIFDENTTSGTHIININYPIGNLIFTGENNITLQLNTGTFLKDIILPNNVTLTGSGAITLFPKGISNIQTNGKTFLTPIILNGGGTVRLLDELTTSSSFTLTQGNLNLNNNILSCDTFNSNNSNQRNINFGDGRIKLNGSGVTLINITTPTNLSATGSKIFELTYTGSVGTRSIVASAGTMGGFNFIVNGGGDSIRIFSQVNSVDFGEFSGTWVTGDARTFFGSLILSENMTLNNATTNITTFNIPDGEIAYLQTRGKTLDFPVTKTGLGTLTILDNFSHGNLRTFALTQGTLNLNKNKITTSIFVTSNSNIRSINFGNNGVLEIMNSGSSFSAATGTNLTTSGIGEIIMTSNSAKTFIGGGRSYPTLVQSGSGALTITGNNTFKRLKNDVVPTTINITAGSTQSVKFMNLTGTPENPVTLNSTTTTNYTLNNIGNLPQVAYSLVVSRSNATPSNSWYGDIYSTGSNTSGWEFLGTGRSAMRLSSGNTFFTDRANNIELDEVSVDTIRISPDTLFAGEFDEVTPIDVKMRVGSDGTLYVSSSFDETDILF